MIKEIKATITDRQVYEMAAFPTPLAIQLRQKLRELGIKFKCDEHFSILFKSPEPLGTLFVSYSVERQETIYIQHLNEDQQ